MSNSRISLDCSGYQDQFDVFFVFVFNNFFSCFSLWQVDKPWVYQLIAANDHARKLWSPFTCSLCNLLCGEGRGFE